MTLQGTSLKSIVKDSIMPKKVLITGASGLLGRAVYKEFTSDKSWQTLGLAFSRATGDLKQVDLRDQEAVNAVIKDFQPDIIVHSAAERKPDVVENKPELTKQINLDATRYLCDAAKTSGAWVLYISTDYVFDGKNPPYKEQDTPNPLNKYGQSKYEGEQITLQVSEGNAVLRVPILYGTVTDLDESAVTVLFPKVKDTSKTCVMSHYERRFPTHCDDIAYVIRELSEKQVQDKSIKGHYHWSGNENMTKYDMAVTMATAFGISTNHIEADNTPSTGATRPYNSQLDCSRIAGLGISKQSKFADRIKEVLKSFV